jgi:hypothetical protein
MTPSRATPATGTEYLDVLPKVVLLSRLQMPVLGVARDGVIVFVSANPACQVMLGGPAVLSIGRPLNHILRVNAAVATDRDTALRSAAGQITIWRPTVTRCFV